MGDVAICFHDQVRVPPEKVDQMRPDAHVDLRCRQAAFPAQPLKILLEIAAISVATIFLADRQTEEVRLANSTAKLPR